MRRHVLSGGVALVLALGLASCRALTEPAPSLRPNGLLDRVVGQAFLPDGSPAAGGELLLDNRIYQADREDWVQARVALDEEGRFDTVLHLGELTDVILDPPDTGGPPSYRFLGLQISDVPWTLRHPMRDVALSLDLPESLAARLHEGTLSLRTHRPRPAGRSAFSENYRLPIDSSATARGWILPGAHEVELQFEHGPGSRLQFEFPDSVGVLAEGIPSLRPWLSEQLVELVLPEGIPGTQEIEFYASQTLTGETTAGVVRSWTVITTELQRAWAILPREFHVVYLVSSDVVLMAQPLISAQAGGVAPIRVADYWLELVAPASGSSADPAWVEVESGGTASGQVGLVDGRALFLVDRGSYYIEVLDGERELLAQWVYEATGSQTLSLDF